MILALLTAGLLLQAPAEPKAPAPVTLPKDLARVLTDYAAAWEGRDAVALAGLFAEDGLALPSGRPPARGRAAVRQYYTGQGGPLALRAYAYGVDGSIAFIVGGYGPSVSEPDTGKFTLTLRKDGDGRWLIFSDMDNGNAPPKPPSPTPAP